MTVYLIHFAQPYKHARHYVGYTACIRDRMQQHRRGRGARQIQVIQAAGIGWQLVRTWPKGTRHLERQIKRRKATPTLCPICNPKMKTFTKPRKRDWL